MFIYCHETNYPKLTYLKQPTFISQLPWSETQVRPSCILRTRYSSLSSLPPLDTMWEDCRPHCSRLQAYNLSREERRSMFTQRSSDLFYGSVPALLLCLPGLTLCNCTQRTSENQVCSVVRVPLGQPTAVTIAGVGKLSFLTSSKTKSLCSGASCRIRLSLEHL